jgi:hypothetical protein
MISSIVLLSGVLLCLFISVSALPLAGRVTSDFQSNPTLSLPYEDFTGSQDDLAANLQQDDALNEIPRYAGSSTTSKLTSFTQFFSLN